MPARRKRREICRKRWDIRRSSKTDRKIQNGLRLSEDELEIMLMLRVRRREPVSTQLGEALVSIAGEGWKKWIARNEAMDTYIRTPIARPWPKNVALSPTETIHLLELAPAVEEG